MEETYEDDLLGTNAREADDPTNWIENGTGVARVPTKEDDVILGGVLDFRFLGVYSVFVHRLDRPVEANSLTVEPCEVCFFLDYYKYSLWDGTQYVEGTGKADPNLGAHCGVTVDVVAPTTFVVTQDIAVGVNSFLRLSGSDQDPWLKAKVKVGEGGRLVLQGGGLTGNGEVHGRVIAHGGSTISPLVYWQERPYPEENGLAGSLHFFGNLELHWAELLFFVNGFDKANFSQVIVHEELYMKPPVHPDAAENELGKANMITVYAGADWTEVLQNNIHVQTPSLVLYESLDRSGSNGTTFVNKTSSLDKAYEMKVTSGDPCRFDPLTPENGPDSCQESTSRHDLSFLLSSSIAIPECPVYGCPGIPECSNRGYCEDGYCICNEGWADLDCSAEDCPGSPDCNGHGHCLVDSRDDTPKCQCLDGWKGEACQTAECPNDCTDEEHGYCDSTTLTPTCVCHVGYLLGPQLDCSLPFQRCPGLEEQCSGFGTCNNQTGNCSCMPGRTGADCSIPVCEGNPNQCSHHGLCLWDEQSNKAFCDCDEGWGGEDCSIPKCSTCSGHGVCVTELDPPRCLCDGPKDIVIGDVSLSDAEGWTGEECAELVMNCNSEESKCGARCGDNGDEGYGCMTNECPEGWKGWDCATPVCVNTGNPECNGHGQCVARERNSTPQCECREGWLPPDCRLVPKMERKNVQDEGGAIFNSLLRSVNAMLSLMVPFVKLMILHVLESQNVQAVASAITELATVMRIGEAWIVPLLIIKENAPTIVLRTECANHRPHQEERTSFLFVIVSKDGLARIVRALKQTKKRKTSWRSIPGLFPLLWSALWCC
ncbi:Tenascin N [Balamuthia mandrillaris]